MTRKSGKIIKEKRILTVQKWILDGVQDDLMRKQIKTQWGIGTRQAKNYIRWAYEAWKRDTDIDMETRREAKIADLLEIKRSLKETYKGTPAGIRALMAVEKQIIRLEPYSVKRVDVTSGGKPIQDMVPRTVVIKEHNG